MRGSLCIPSIISLRSLLRYAYDSRTGFALWLFIDGCKHLIQPFNLIFRFTLLFESSLSAHRFGWPLTS